MGGTGVDRDVWKTALSVFEGGLGMGSFQRRKGELADQRYTILLQLDDPSEVGSTISSLLKAPGKFPAKSFGDLHPHVRSLCDREQKLWAKDNSDMWSPIVNERFLHVNGRADSRGYSCFSAALKLLLEVL